VGARAAGRDRCRVGWGTGNGGDWGPRLRPREMPRSMRRPAWGRRAAGRPDPLAWMPGYTLGRGGGWGGGGAWVPAVQAVLPGRDDRCRSSAAPPTPGKPTCRTSATDVLDTGQDTPTGRPRILSTLGHARRSSHDGDHYAAATYAPTQGSRPPHPTPPQQAHAVRIPTADLVRFCFASGTCDVC